MWRQIAEGVAGTNVDGLEIRVFEWPHANTQEKSWAFTVRRDGISGRYFHFEEGIDTESDARLYSVRHARGALRIEKQNAEGDQCR